MSYYLEVSASEVPPSSATRTCLTPRRVKAFSQEDEIRLYLFLKHLYSEFPAEDDITIQEDADRSIWSNNVQLHDDTLTLGLIYTKAETVVAAITGSARKYGLSVFDFQSGQVFRRSREKLSVKELSSYPLAHKYLTELAEWSKFSQELEKHAGDKNEEQRLTKLASTGYGPAKRALSFYYYLNYFRGTDNEVRRLNLQRAYDLIKEVDTTAYASRSLTEIYRLAAKQEGLILD